MLRSDVFQRFSYRDMGWPEDYDLLLRLLGSGHALGVVPRRLLLWRDSPERLSRRSEVYAERRFVAAKAHFLARSWLAGHARYVLWGYGETGRALCRALQLHDRHPQAIVEVHPGRLGQRIGGEAPPHHGHVDRQGGVERIEVMKTQRSLDAPPGHLHQSGLAALA